MKKDFGVKNRKMKAAESGSGFAAAWALSAALFVLPPIASSCSDETPPESPGESDAASKREMASKRETAVFPSNDAGERINRYWGKESAYSDGKSTPDSVSLLHIPATDIVDYVVPEGYTAISSGVFKNCKKLESITIPDSVKTIEGGAFNEHKTLKRVSLPASISIGGKTPKANPPRKTPKSGMRRSRNAAN